MESLSLQDPFKFRDMSLIRLGGKGRTLLGSVRSGQVYFSKRGHVTLPGELPGLVAHSSEVFDRELHKLNLRQQVHPSLRRSLSRVITQVDYRIGDSVHFDRGRLEFDNLALLHFLDQLQHLLAMGSSHLSSTRGMAITVVADERSRDWQPDAAVRSGSQNGVNSANLLGEELMW